MNTHGDRTDPETSFERKVSFHERMAAEQWAASPTAYFKGGEAQRYLFVNYSELFPHSVICRGQDVRGLALDPKPVAAVVVDLPEMSTSVGQFLDKSHVDGLVVLHEGRIAFESYPGMLSWKKHIWFSISKTLVSTSVGILESRGLIDTSESVDAYLPRLKGSAWENTPVIDILDMSSGIDCLTDFEHRNSNHWRMLDSYGCFTSGGEAADEFASFTSLARHRPPGQVFEYSDANPFVLTLLIETISNQPYAEFVSREIWQPMGSEGDGLLHCGARGRAVSAFGVSSTLRDLARFGLLFTPAGRPAGVVPQELVRKIQIGGRPQLIRETEFPDLIGDGSWRHNTYQWDLVTTDGDFFKSGAFGQGLYVSPRSDTVIAFFSTDPGPYGTYPEAVRVARQIVNSESWR